MLKDQHHRPLRDLRISVTDRCNFRCSYCMPNAEYEWLARKEILTFEEITRLARLFVAAGVESIRLTGGEPLLRTALPGLVRRLAALPGLQDLSLTTNGTRLETLALPLREAGLERVNVSLDTLQPRRFRELARRDDLKVVLRGLAAARTAGLAPIKVNMVVQRGVNDDEILPMLEFCSEQGYSLRYIEFMDVGNANDWHLGRMVPASEILRTVKGHRALGPSHREHASDPAMLHSFAGGSGDVGVIASVSQPFCNRCDRARLTAAGQLVTCLFSRRGTDLKALLRSGVGDQDLAQHIATIWQGRTDRFSEERLEALRSAAGYDPQQRIKLEMISLGG